jgi:hypothetical protein
LRRRGVGGGAVTFSSAKALSHSKSIAMPLDSLQNLRV